MSKDEQAIEATEATEATASDAAQAETPTEPDAPQDPEPEEPATPALALDRLTRIAADIEALHRARFTDLVHRLETEEGLAFSDGSMGEVVCKMAGVRAQSTAGRHGALTNWANKARRTVLKGGVK